MIADVTIIVPRERWGEAEWTARDLYEALPEQTNWIFSGAHVDAAIVPGGEA